MVLNKTLLGGIALATAMIFAGCAPATESNEKAKPFGGAATLDGWTVGPNTDDGNTMSADNFRMKYVSNDGGRALAVQYGASASYKMSNLYYDPLTNEDYSGYDQLVFDVKTDAPVNFVVALRGFDSDGTATGNAQVWTSSAAQEYQGPTDGDYAEHTVTLADMGEPGGWGSNGNYDTAEDWLNDTADGAVWKQLNFLPKHNPGDPVTNAAGSKLVLYIDNVRLHDSTGTNDDKVLFDFEEVVE